MRTMQRLALTLVSGVALGLGAGSCGGESATDTGGDTSGGDDGDCPIGTEGCPCTSGGACDPGLECRSELCVDADGDGGDGASASGSGADDGGTGDATGASDGTSDAGDGTSSGDSTSGTGTSSGSADSTSSGTGGDATSTTGAIDCAGVDVLLILDASASSEGDDAMPAVGALVSALDAGLGSGVSVRFGVTSSGFCDGTTPAESTSNCQSQSTPQEIDDAYIPPTESTTALNGGQGRLIEHQGVRYVEHDVGSPTTDATAWTSFAVGLATGGCQIEMITAGAAYAAHPSNDATNGAFFRDNALLALVFVTSQVDKSPDPRSTYVNMLTTKKASCGGTDCIVAHGLVNEGCYGHANAPELKAFLDEFGTPTIENIPADLADYQLAFESIGNAIVAACQ